MQFLNSFKEPLTFIDESEWTFFDLWTLCDYLEGAPNKDKNSLAKYLDIEKILSENEIENPGVKYHNFHTTGISIRFFTNSPSVIVKAEIRRPYSYKNVNMCCTHGFDVYATNNQETTHIMAIAPTEPHRVFAEQVNLHNPTDVQIYFPTYNEVVNFCLGIKLGACLLPPSPRPNNDVICIYGNSRTQGASASRSGNIFPNIISRILNSEIYNYSFSTGCRAELSAAQQIVENLNRQNRKMSAFVLDYNANATNLEEFSQRLSPFYKVIRSAYPHIPIVILNAFCTPYYDKPITNLLEESQNDGENTFYVDLNSLFKSEDLTALTVDRVHYTDFGMFLVANKICECIKEGWGRGSYK
jgi:hypothetical protein